MDTEEMWTTRRDILRRKWNKEFSSTKIKFFSNTHNTKIETLDSKKLQEKKLKRCLKGDSLVDDKYVNGETLFHIFARENNPDMIEELFKHNFKIQKDDFGFYPWHAAAAFGSLEALTVFVNHNCDITNRVDFWDFNILHIATVGIGSYTQRIEIIKYILNEIPQISIDATDTYGRTPLILSSTYAKEEEGMFLLSQGSDPTIIPVYGLTAVGISAMNSPRFCCHLLNWVLLKKTESSSKVTDFPTLLDITSIYLMRAPATVILHPFIASMLSSTSTGIMRGIQIFFLVLSFIDIIASSFLCMTNTYDYSNARENHPDSFEEIIYYFCLSWAIVALLIITIKDITEFKSILQSFWNPTGSDTYQKTKYHPYINADKTKVMNMVQKMFTKARQHLLYNFIESGLGIVARVITICAQFWVARGEDKMYERNYKAYALSFALIAMWWSFFTAMEGITIISQYLLILGLTIKRCILAVLEIIIVACTLALPFVLIFVKMSKMDERVIYQNEKEESKTLVSELKRGFYAYHHMFRIMTLDNYHDNLFEKNHHVLLSIFYPITITIFSLVILNMCIAKLSWLYKTIVSSSQYHLMRERLIMKIFWDKLAVSISKKLTKIHAFKNG